MIYISKKGPSNKIMKAITEIRSDPNWKNASDTQSIRSFFDKLPKEEIRKSLLIEQHYLCAYCMKQIKNDSLHTTIEHFYSLSNDKNKALDYKNLLLVCDGGRNKTNGICCCDVTKKEKKLTINPLKEYMMDKINYKKDGTIYYEDINNKKEEEKIQFDIDTILNLNGEIKNDKRIDTFTEILKGRRDAYKQYETIIKKLEKKEELNSNKIENEIKNIKSKEKYCEFIGVIVFFLERKKKLLMK